MTYKELPLTPPITATVKSSDSNKGLTDQGTANATPTRWGGAETGSLFGEQYGRAPRGER